MGEKGSGVQTCGPEFAHHCCATHSLLWFQEIMSDGSLSRAKAGGCDEGKILLRTGERK